MRKETTFSPCTHVRVPEKPGNEATSPRLIPNVSEEWPGNEAKCPGLCTFITLLYLFVFRVQGIHLLDTMDDGTEMVAPDPFLPSFSPQQQDVDTSSGG